MKTRQEANGTYSYELFGDWIPTQATMRIGAQVQRKQTLAEDARFLGSSRKGSYLDWRHA